MKRVMERANPSYYCICGDYIGFTGFCSKKCHDEYYDEVVSSYATIAEVKKNEIKKRW